MLDPKRYILLLALICISAGAAFAQYPTNQNPNYPNNNTQRNTNPFNNKDTTTQKKALSGDQEIDAQRQKEEKKRDSVVFTSKFIKVTNERLLNDSTQVFPLDTGSALIAAVLPVFRFLT